jgi:2-oxoglutarate ferredoxin oxidoreductase subunit alpha
VIAANGPGDCFYTILEAFRLAVKHMTPVIVLSDGYIANSSEPWKIPDVDALPRHPVELHVRSEGFHPYQRDPDTLARPWAVPGPPGLEHRIGGLTKANVTGNVVYDPENHEEMVKVRADKIARIANDIPPAEVDGPDRGELLVVGWGGTLGSITAAVEAARKKGLAVSSLHLRHLNPFPSNLGDVLAGFDKVLVPELNEGQLSMLLRARYLCPAQAYNKIAGQPFKVSELLERIERALAEEV